MGELTDFVEKRFSNSGGCRHRRAGVSRDSALRAETLFGLRAWSYVPLGGLQRASTDLRDGEGLG
jgi:hypothetical protein